MKKQTYFLLCGLFALVLFLLFILVFVLMGYQFVSYRQANGHTLRYYGTKEKGTVYYYNRTASYTPGQLIFSNGDRYEGEISHYLPWGEGVYTYACGEVYTGAFEEGLPHGQGVLTYVDGSTLAARFEKERPVGDVILTLCYDNGQTEVLTGEIFTADTDVSLTYSYRNGANYVGGYRNGLAWGTGTLTFSNNDSYVGSFDQGEMSIFGKYTYADGSVYEGEFKNGMPNGKGSYTYDFHGITRRVEGVFYNGKWIHGEEDAASDS